MTRSFNGLMMASALLAGAVLSGCDKTEIPPYTYEVFDLGVTGDGLTEFIPGAPIIDANQQIDRAGRPLINLYLTNPFNKANRTPLTIAQDEYNKATTSSQPNSWSTYAGATYFQKNLAIFDALIDTSTTACGNQLLYPTGSPTTSSYSELATRLADDRLYVDTSKGLCNTYFAVERYSLAGDTTLQGDCGGRNPIVDVADATLTLLAGTPVGDGLGGDPDGTASTSMFPFFLAPK